MRQWDKKSDGDEYKSHASRKTRESRNVNLFLGQGHAGNEAVSSVAYVGQETFLKYTRASS